MDFFIYLILGMLDTFAILALAFKFYRFPFFEYIKEVLVMCILITLSSYIVRVEFNLGVLDLIVQLLLYIFFFRRIIKVRLKASIALSLLYFVYGALSYGFYFIYRAFSIVSPGVVDQSTGPEAYLMQLTTSLSALLISWIMYRFRLGRSSIARPPHFLGDKFTLKEILIICLLFSFGSILIYIFHYIEHWRATLAIPVVLLSVLALAYLSNRKGISG
ncbi:hypothetical protein [Paenibacillus elgii]|uniref:hypothetical protein n=1 Tax=Paenibacillus elgii TaxID=189691 RepID=UPI0013D483A8|nr:hypothetical protein [Paenibacillus elgii]